MSLRVVFMGTPDFSVPTLSAVAGAGHEVAAVYTRAPAAAGRGLELRPSPVHRLAESLRLPVLTPRSLRTEEAADAFGAHGADVAVVVAYGMILPPAILSAPRLGCLNLHASLLPRWRGAAPIQRAILAGDAQSGISVFQMEEGLDTGPVYAMRPVPIGPGTTASELHDRLATLAAEMIPGIVDKLAAGTLRPEPQPEEGVTYAHKLRREEGLIDFAEPAAMVERRLRALNPWPGCHTEVAGERLMLLEGKVEADAPTGAGPGTVVGLPLTVACGEGALRLTRVQRAGRKAMGAEELQRGFVVPVGSRLGGERGVT